MNRLATSRAAQQQLLRDRWITLGALALLATWELLGWDRPLAAWFGTANGFAWREHWLTSGVMHQGGRALGWAVLLFLLVDAVRPRIAGPSQRARWIWLGATLIGLLVVPGLKRLSRTSCPWDLTNFGGAIPYVPHWNLQLADGGPGHCFPSGHAVAAFAFFSVWFLLRDNRPRLARTSLWAVLGIGTMFGVAQLARGAHFPSHTLWSAWCCWTICVMVAHAIHAARLKQTHAPRPGKP